ncbi:hypothetical protein CY34DRAFT_805250 [Suillus luteus UH-Slu-Lm8-n1]|uniref:Uncharacterized protein n=1 Tax=Suillus luteus UH-Slu-Lm8-n1 TaxID=930992 RepID=A0A0D0AJZ2_9AGAM|nr:hypothetical protein CY34DRAFT_805250 [Suillus luteus UH-Slu-Lm8-n1]
MQGRGHYSSTRYAQPSAHRRSSIFVSLGSRPRAALGRLSSLFQRSPPIGQDTITQLQQRPRQGSSHQPPVVEVAAAKDKRVFNCLAVPPALMYLVDFICCPTP